MLLARGLLAVGGPLPRVGNRQRGRQHQHFTHASLGVGLKDHPAEPRVDRQPREAAAEVGDRAVAVEGAELLQQQHTVADAALVWRIEEREVLDVAELKRGHLQDDGGEVGPQNLGIGEPRPRGEVLL